MDIKIKLNNASKNKNKTTANRYKITSSIQKFHLIEARN